MATLPRAPKKIGFAEGGGRLPKLEDFLNDLSETAETDISANEDNVSTNADDISTNADNISDNADNISDNAEALGKIEPDRVIKAGTELNGINPSPMAFGDDTIAEITGDETENFDLKEGDRELKVDPDGAGEETITFTAAAGKHTSDEDPSEDIEGVGADKKFMIRVDGETDFQEVDLSISGKNSGTLIAAEMESVIQALGGVYVAVTVTFEDIGSADERYVITSGTKGTGSSVEIDDHETNNIADDLKIGTDNGGVSEAGTGFAVNAEESSATEVVDHINAGATDFEAAEEDSKIVLKSKTAGRGSTLVMGDGTANARLGFTNSEGIGGAQGLDIDDAEDTEYKVMLTLLGETLTDRVLSVAGKGTTGFDIHCETEAAENEVDIMIFD